MHQSGRPVWGWRETLALPRPQKIIRPAHTPLKSDFYNKICHSGLVRRSKKPSGLRFLCIRPHEPSALQALGGLDCVEIMEFRIPWETPVHWARPPA